jgi:hypothetical protein
MITHPVDIFDNGKRTTDMCHISCVALLAACWYSTGEKNMEAHKDPFPIVDSNVFRL